MLAGSILVDRHIKKKHKKQMKFRELWLQLFFLIQTHKGLMKSNRIESNSICCRLSQPKITIIIISVDVRSSFSLPFLVNDHETIYFVANGNKWQQKMERTKQKTKREREKKIKSMFDDTMWQRRMTLVWVCALKSFWIRFVWILADGHF